MGDERLRERERRWRESGAVEDEAAYLFERVRAGDLEEARLRLAARVGHPAALIATGAAISPHTPDLSTWFGSLLVFGPLGFLRACVAVAWLEVEREPRRTTDRSALVELIEPFVLDPTDERRERVARFVRSEASKRTTLRMVRLLLVQITEHGLRVPPAHQGKSGKRLRAAAAEIGPYLMPRPAGGLPEGRYFMRGIHPPAPLTPEEKEEEERHGRACKEARAAGERLLWTTVRDEVVPWALGVGDPIARRASPAAP